MIEKIKETAAYIAAKVQVMPKTAIILGTGLGELVDHITDKTEIPYTEIPNFPVSTVEGHQGKLIFGKLGKKDVMAMQGRFHYYEGYDMKQVTFPVRVMKELGIEHLFVSNAAGGMNPDFAIGDIMIIRDHINLFPEHPLHGRNYKELGVRFPDISLSSPEDLSPRSSRNIFFSSSSSSEISCSICAQITNTPQCSFSANSRTA